MINVSQTFKDGVTAQSRKVSVRAVIDITPLDVTYTGVTGSTASAYSKSAQVYDENVNLGYRGISYEINRWIIGDSNFRAYNHSSMSTQEVGYESRQIFNATGTLNSGVTAPYVQMNFENVSILQACHIYFPNNQYDGYAVNFTVQIMQGNSAAYTATYTDNRKPDIFVAGFTVYWPTAVRITVTKWSLPFRRMRVPEIWLGMHDEWLDNMFASFNIQQKGSFTSSSLPYTTCSMQIDNSDRRFDPTSKESMFLSLEERQPIVVYFSVNDSEYYPIGTYYHYSGGWKTGNSQLTLGWNLVDLIGLLVDRQFDVYEYLGPNGTALAPLPTTLEAWVQTILGQLGERYANMYEIPAAYRDISLVVTDVGSDWGGQQITSAPKRLEGKTCGDILKWICQATHTWPRALPNGYLYIGGFERYGQNSFDNVFKLDYDNLSQYPTLQANEDIARFDFKFGDGSGNPYAVMGNSQSSPNTQAIENPFITTQEQANSFVTYCMPFYGGSLMKTTGRGNPMLEIGDLAYVETAKGAYTAGRIMEQSFTISDHIMKSCQTTLLMVRPDVDFNRFVVITEDMTWTVPGNVRITDGYAQLKVVLVQAGETGGHGDWGSGPNIHTWDGFYPDGVAGQPGWGGHGGRINDVRVNGEYLHVNRGQVINIHIGRSLPPETISIISESWWGDDGQLWYIPNGDRSQIEGGHSTATINGTVFTSADGLPRNYTNYNTEQVEPISQKILSKSAQWSPRPNSGDGGRGGEGGDPPRGAPSYGVQGADGCVIICYSIEEA